MTGVETDDVVQGCVKYLLGLSQLTAVVGQYDSPLVVGLPPVDPTPWIFQDKVLHQMEGSQQTAAVVSLAGAWSSPNSYNTLDLPRISLELWADPLRDDDYNAVSTAETRRRIMAAYLLFDRALHRPQGGVVCWGSLRTINCTRLGGVSVYPTPDGDGLLRGQVFYGVQIG